jgi:hypothetical protein
MKQYKPRGKKVKSEDDNPHVKETLFFDREYNGYFLRTSTKLIDMKILDKDEYFRFLAGDVSSFFPQYDEKIHYCDIPIYNTVSDLTINDIVPVSLFEYYSDENKFFGCYIFENTPRGVLLRKINFSSDEYIDLKGNIDLHKDFTNFCKDKKKYEALGLRARKGLLFYGPPGNGKTAQISQLSKFAEKEQFRLFFVDKDISLRNLFPFKDLFEKEPSVFVIEELTERTGGSRDSEELLSFLDGELSWNNSYVIATTNHPEELPWNLIDRPSRFKVKLEFPNPTPSERKRYLEHMKVPKECVDETVELTEGMSLDYVKNIVLDSFLEDKAIPEIIKENKKTKEKIACKFSTKKMGLGI